MSNLTRGILSIAFIFMTLSASLGQDADRVHRKTYPIERVPAENVRQRLQALMPGDLKRYTYLFVDAQTNELTVQGPLAAIEMADEFVPWSQEIKQNLTYGTFSPINAFTQTSPKESTSPRGRVYHCAVRDFRAFEMELNRRFGNNPAVSFVFTDYAENQTFNIAVLAPEEVQTEFGKVLQEMGVLLPKPQKKDNSENDLAKMTQRRFQPGDFAIVNHTYKPMVKSIGLIDSKLCAALGKRYTRLSPPVEGKQSTGMAVFEYVIQTAEQTRSLRLELDYDRREVFLNGDKRLCEQMLQLIEMIDRPNLPEGMEGKIIKIGGKQAKQVRQFVDVLAMQSHQQSSLAQSPPQAPLPQSVTQPVNRTAAVSIPKFDQRAPSQFQPSQFQQSQYLQPQYQPPQYQPPQNQPSQNQQPRYQQPQFDATTPFSINGPVQRTVYKPQQDLSGLGDGGAFDQGGGPGAFSGDMSGGLYGYEPSPGGAGQRGSGFEVPPSLNINVLPELDIILIDGNNADLRRFQEMIDDIEKLIAQSDSKWYIIPLKNTDCISMNEMLYDMTNYLLFSQKAGKYNLFPLRNPNALMVIGWGPVCEEIISLIEALDTPLSEPGSCWKVFPLKHASATYVSTLLTGMYPPPSLQTPTPFNPRPNGPGWMPRIRTAIDTRTNSIIVHAGPNDLKEIEMFLRKIDLYESGPQVRIKQFKLRHSMATDVSTKLTGILAPTATASEAAPTFAIEVLDEGERRLLQSGIIANFKVTPDPQQNMLIVSAPEYALPLIEKLIEMLDSPVPTSAIKMIPLFNASAEKVVGILTNLIPSQLMNGQGVGQQMPGSRQGGDFIPLKFATDERSNVIIVVGSMDDITAVEAIIAQLDKDDTEKRVQKVFTLKNAKADEVAQTIQDFITQKQKLIGETPGGVSAFVQMEESLIVVADKRTNSLVIEAQPRYFAEIIKMVEDIDRQPDQVVIQVLIAEVSLSNGKEFGAELGLQDSILFNRSTFSNGVGDPGFNFGDPAKSLGNNKSLPDSLPGTVAPQLLSNFNMGRTGRETGFGGAVFSASSESVSILIRALEERRRLEVLSRPQIMAMDNQLAFILIGERVSFNSGSTMSNTGYLMANVKMEEVGLMLMVKPQISPDGKVVMDIGVEKSSVGSESDGTSLPDGSGQTYKVPKISAITTKTNITASNNETVMLGGLLSKETLCVNRRVPFIADIPVLGRLFQYNYDTVQKKELFIILTPRVIKHRKGVLLSEDSERIKREEEAKIHWCLKDVIKMHGTPNNENSLRIWDPMAEEPVTGGALPLYPTLPTPLEELDVLPSPPTRNKPVPVPAFEQKSPPEPERIFE